MMAGSNLYKARTTLSLYCLETVRSTKLPKKMILYFILVVVCFTPGLLACSLPPYTRFYSVTERTILAPIVVQARVINTTHSDSSIQLKYKACIELEKEKVIKGREYNVPKSFCLGTFGPDFLCLVDARAGFSYVFFINEDFTARYDGFPAAVAPAGDRIIKEAKRGYCDPYGVEDERKCELPTIEYSTFKRYPFVSESEDLTLPCVHTGTPPLISKWTKKGAPLIGPPGALRLREVSRKDAGVYICTVYNPAGKAKERSYVRILPTPCGGFVAVQPSKQITVQSPNYPRPFPKDKMCSWRICPPLGKGLEVTFNKFDLRLVDRLEIANECDRRLQPWQINCGSVSPGTFVSQCSSCLRLGLASSYSPNRIATGFNATVATTEKGRTEFDVEKLWCDYDLVVKARPEELAFGKTWAAVIENYKDGPPLAGQDLNFTQDMTVTNIFGCPSDLKYNRHYYMMINLKADKHHLKHAMMVAAPEIPNKFVENLEEYKISKPNCKR